MSDELLTNYRAMWRHEPQREGTLIAICGFDGSGKTTQIALLAEQLRRSGRKLLQTRQPTDWYRGDPWARGYIDNGTPADPQALALFAAADRRRHSTEVLDPALKRGDVVLTDRYVYSSLAYFKARGLRMATTARINFELPRPDLAVFLDIPPEVAVERIRQRDGKLKFEEIDRGRIASIRDAFLEVARLDDDFLVIDGCQPVADIAKRISELADGIEASRRAVMQPQAVL